MGDPEYSVRPSEKSSDDPLVALALDLRWSWNHAADELWRLLDPDLWDLTHNPWIMLQTVSRDKIRGRLQDAAFQQMLHELLESQRNARESPAWFQQAHPDSGLNSVAYFSMEFMLSEALAHLLRRPGQRGRRSTQDRQRPGRACDRRRACSTSRAISGRRSTPTDASRRCIRSTIRGNCPSRRVRETNGEWLRLPIPLAGLPRCWLRAWQAQVGRVASCICWTPTTRPISRRIAASPANSMAAARTCA